MADSVKPTRRYESPRRREQAAATRRSILDAAQQHFETDGYAATTMGAIAADAGVALKTVYVAFETKSGLLRALWHLLLRGDEDAAPVGERRWYLDVLQETDPVRKLRLVAHNSRLVKERAGSILVVIRDAAPVDPDIAELWGRIETDFYANQRAIVASLEQTGSLRKGLDARSAADLLWTLNHPDLWRLLVIERGWSPDRFEEWLSEAICADLLGVRRSARRARS
jgi:AcrR family transcriptional regulator